MPTVMSKYAHRVMIGTERIMKDAALVAHRTAVSNTPVVTGRARSNWTMSINAPYPGSRLPYFPYPPFSGPKFGEGSNKAAAIIQGVRVVAQFNILQHRSLDITNNVRYIGAINEYSRQSVHFFEDAVDAARDAIVGKKILEVNTLTGATRII
jgi:hypothetical protein